MNHKRWTVFAVIAAMLSLIALIGLIALEPCTGSIETAAGGSVPMKCHWTFKAEIPVAILMLLTALSQFFLKGTEGRRLSSLFIMATALVGFSLTTDGVIGLCANPEMECHKVALFCRIIYILLALTGAIQLFKPDNQPKGHKPTF